MDEFTLQRRLDYLPWQILHVSVLPTFIKAWSVSSAPRSTLSNRRAAGLCIVRAPCSHLQEHRCMAARKKEQASVLQSCLGFRPAPSAAQWPEGMYASLRVLITLHLSLL